LSKISPSPPQKLVDRKKAVCFYPKPMYTRNSSSVKVETGSFGGLPARALILSTSLLLGSGITLLILIYGAGSG
jgi:hypothetical protein